MNRGTFFKRLIQGAAVIAVSPKILSEVSRKSYELSASDYVAGYVSFSKKMLTDLPHFGDIRNRITIDYMRIENEKFFGK